MGEFYFNLLDRQYLMRPWDQPKRIHYNYICYKESIKSQVNYCLQLGFKQRGRVLLSIKSLGILLIVTRLIAEVLLLVFFICNAV